MFHSIGLGQAWSAFSQLVVHVGGAILGVVFLDAKKESELSSKKRSSTASASVPACGWVPAFCSPWLFSVIEYDVELS